MAPQQDEPTVRDFLRPLARNKWLILAFTLVASVATYVYYDRQAETYEASTKILISAAGNPLDASATELSDRTVQDQAGLLTSRAVAERVAQRLGVPGQGSTLASSLTATATPGSNFVSITARRAGAEDAARVANAFAEEFVALRSSAARETLQRAIDASEAQLRQLPRTQRNAAERASISESIRELRLNQAVSTGSASQVDPALPPDSPVGPHPLRNALLALVLAGVGSAGLAYALQALDRHPRRIEELETLYGMPVLATMPHVGDTKHEEAGHVAVKPDFKEPLRQLRTNIQLAALDRPFKTILVTSAVAGEGKSTVVRNLALVLREGGLRVAVVDADLRRPTLAGLFGQRSEPGLTDVLTGRVRIDEALVPVAVQVHGLDTLARMGVASGSQGVSRSGHALSSDTDSVTLLPAGPEPADPQAVLSADRTRQLLQHLAGEYDVVLVDSPPLLRVTDAVALSRYVDAVVVVARLGVVTRDEAKRLPDVLRNSGATPVGIVVNDVPTDDGYGYGYGSSG